MSSVDTFIQHQHGPVARCLQHVHALVMEYPGVEAKIRYRIPFYYGRSWLCYLNPQKDESVEWAFTRANEWPRHHELLDFRGRKQVAGLFLTADGLPEEGLMRLLLEEALALDAARPYASKRRGKAS
jgi:hypothetical protein